MKLGYIALAAAGAISLAAAPAQAKVVHFSTTLNGASEVPPNTTKGTGTLTADFNTATNKLTYTATYKGLTGPAVAAHFHGPAAPGANAPPIVTVKQLPSPMKGSATLTAAQAKDLQAGKWYFNIHTAAHPSGEIRGQLTGS